MADHTGFEHAPLTAFPVRVALAGTIGQFSNGFIPGVIGIALSRATPALHLSAVDLGLIGAASLVGMFVGGLASGVIADRMGRRPIFAWDMAVFAIVAAAQSLVTTSWQLLLLRVLLGILLGVDSVVSKSLVTEHSPQRFRGRLLSVLAVVWTFGYVAAYLVGYLLDGATWRLLLLTSALPALLALGFRVRVPESPLWLSAHRQTTEGEQVMSGHLGPGITAPAPPPVLTEQAGLRTLISPRWRKHTAVACVFFTCQITPFFALGTFSSRVMESLHVTNKYGAGAIYNIFLLAGAVLGLVVIDRITRRQFLIGSFMITAGVLLVLALWPRLSSITVVVGFAVFALILSAAVNLEFVYLPELFGTQVRARGCGVALATSRIGSATGTFLLPVILSTWGLPYALLTCVVVLFLGAAVCYTWAPETGNQHPRWQLVEAR